MKKSSMSQWLNNPPTDVIRLKDGRDLACYHIGRKLYL
jgi:hypothetical protein